MANPQPDKFTKFSNELLEAYIRIAKILSPYENVVWLCIFRKTYGYKQKEDWISLSQIEIMTGIRQPHVARTKKKLLLKNMIAKRNSGVGIQKDYDQWNIPKQVYLNRYDIPNQVLPKQVTKLTQTGNRDLPKQVSLPLPKQVDTKESTKDTLTKETITKERFGYLSDHIFVSIFESYLKGRKTKATDHAKELILKDLHKVDKSVAIAMLEQSIKNGWVGVFPLKRENFNVRDKGVAEQKYAGVERQV